MSGDVFDHPSAAAHFEGVFGYRIANLDLLERALTHPSYASENPHSSDYQRLEFLGDAVLELAVTSFIYEEYATATEGEMTLIRAAVVSEPALASIAESWGLCDRLLLGRGEELSGGRAKRSILSDVVESLLATVYLDAGFARVNQIVRDHWAPMIRERAGEPGQRDFDAAPRDTRSRRADHRVHGHRDRSATCEAVRSDRVVVRRGPRERFGHFEETRRTRRSEKSTEIAGRHQVDTRLETRDCLGSRISLPLCRDGTASGRAGLYSIVTRM